MGLFKKAHSSPEQEKAEALLTTAMKYSPCSKDCDEAQFRAAVEALREAGQPAHDYLVAEAQKGVNLKQVDAFWATVVEMDDDIVPGIDSVLKKGGSTSQRRAALALCTFAERSPEVRERCVAALKEAAASGENELVSHEAGKCLEELQAKGILND